MVVSSILELQREFPVSTDPLIDRCCREDLDDEIVPDDEIHSMNPREPSSLSFKHFRHEMNLYG